MGMFVHHEQEISADLWNVFKKHYNLKTNQEAVDAVEDLKVVCKKYGSEFCNAMSVVMFDQLRLRWFENSMKEKVDDKKGTT